MYFAVTSCDQILPSVTSCLHVCFMISVKLCFWIMIQNVSKMCPKFGYNMDIILDTFCIIYQITIWPISWNILGDNWSHSVKSGHNLWQQNTFIFCDHTWRQLIKPCDSWSHLKKHLITPGNIWSHLALAGIVSGTSCHNVWPELICCDQPVISCDQTVEGVTS